MRTLGYCNRCDCKIIEVRSLGGFDDFTIKCPNCKKLIPLGDIRFKRIEETVDRVLPIAYTMGRVENQTE